MGRPPNGAPQRVSMHVVPKAQARAAAGADAGAVAADDDGDDKTTIESGWEDEDASTTVEQGEVAEKLRALAQNGGLDPSEPVPRRNITGITRTGAGADEPTVDEQRSNLLASAPGAARMVVTEGPDTGKDLAIVASEAGPGGAKVYTIGRALDNDIVLTDLAVSRKHFDLRFEGGAWVIVDRGSGNGTVVNGNLEDNPFMLANGDAIEIGNTTFRFEQQTAAAPAAPPEIARSSQPTFDIDVESEVLYAGSHQHQQHDDDDEPSTVAGKQLGRHHTPVEPVLLPVSAPVSASVPSQLARPKTLPPPVPYPRSSSQHQAQLPPYTTSPYSGGMPGSANPSSTMPLPQMANRPPMPAPAILGEVATMQGHGMPVQVPSAIMPAIAPQPPMYYAPPELAQASPYPPQLIVQPHNMRRLDASTAHVSPTPYDGAMIADPGRFAPPQLSRTMKLALLFGGLTVVVALVTVAVMHSRHGAVADAQAPAPTQPAPTPPPKKTVLQPIPADPPQKVATAPTVTPLPQPPTPAPTPPAPAAVPVVTPAHVTPTPTPAPTPPVHAQVATHTPSSSSSSSARPSSSNNSPPPAPHVALADPHFDAPAAAPSTASIDSARKRADDDYLAKRFADAASVLNAAAKVSDASTAGKLKLEAQRYAAFGRAYNLGTAPGSSPDDLFDNLRAAIGYDQNLGGHYSKELGDKLAEIAPKAALTFVGSGDFEKARTAVNEAEQNGMAGNGSIQLVKGKLERAASELYADAQKSGLSSPDGKDKLRRIKQIVDSSSPWYQKATKALLGGA